MFHTFRFQVYSNIAHIFLFAHLFFETGSDFVALASRPNCPATQREMPASTSQVLEIKAIHSQLNFIDF